MTRGTATAGPPGAQRRGTPAEQGTALATPRRRARFLCGLTSPALTLAKLTRHPLFGALEERRFAEVLAWCTEEGGAEYRSARSDPGGLPHFRPRARRATLQAFFRSPFPRSAPTAMPIPPRLRRLLAPAGALLLAASPAAAQGVWRVEYPAVKSPLHSEIRDALRSDRSLDLLAGPLNEGFPVERDVVIEIAECGAPRSYYTPTRPAVRVCYELVLLLAEEMQREGGEGEGVAGDAIGIILLHGVGRAILDQLALPTSLPPEVAADELTAYLLTEDDGELGFLAAAALAERELDWEGGAPFTRARGENVICLLYGADPRRHAWVVAEGLLPATRAAGCADEFRQVSEFWGLILGEIGG